MIRQPSFAGLLYPDSPQALRSLVNSFLDSSDIPITQGPIRALVVPHSSYRFSGSVAGSAFRALQGSGSLIDRVLLIGPSHRIAFPGVALPKEGVFATPLGQIPVDQSMMRIASKIPGVGDHPEAHYKEQSLEVQLPFLQQVLGSFSLLPLLVGDCPPVVLAEILEIFAKDPAMLFVVSTEFAHHRDAELVRKWDKESANKILALDPSIEKTHSSGAIILNGLLTLAQKHSWTPKLLDLRNSGDTTGNADNTVGYGAFAFTDEHLQK